MDRAEGALRVAERAIEETKRLAAEVEAMKTAPKGAVSFLIDDAGDLLAIRDDGSTANMGRVRGADGRPGESIRGEPGPRGEPGESVKGDAGDRGADGRDGRDGRDAIGLRTAEVRDGYLILTLSDGSELNAGNVRGPAGRDGADGKDGESIKGDAGAPGRDGRDGADGKPGARGPAGRNGRDGVDATPMLILGDAEYPALKAEDLRRVRTQRITIGDTEIVALVLAD